MQEKAAVFFPLPVLFNNVDSWKERGEDVVAPLIGWKKRNHGREQTNEGADVTMRGVVTYKLDSCLPISRLPMLSPTRVNCPSWGATPQSCKAKVIPAPSEWLRSSKMKHPGVTVLNREQEYDLFSTHQISWLFEAHWILPTIYKPYACTQHTPVYFLMCHIPRNDWLKHQRPVLYKFDLYIWVAHQFIVCTWLRWWSMAAQPPPLTAETYITVSHRGSAHLCAL